MPALSYFRQMISQTNLCKFLLLHIFFSLSIVSQAKNVAVETQDTVYLYAESIDAPKHSFDLNDVFADSRGYLYLIYEQAVYRYNGQQFEEIECNSSTQHSFIRAKEIRGRVYIYDFLGQLFYIEDNCIIAYPHNQQLLDLNSFYNTIDYYLDPDDNLYISLEGNTLIKIDKQGQLSYPIHKDNPIITGYCAWPIDSNQYLFMTVNNASTLRRDTFYLFDKKFKVIDKFPVPSKGYKQPVSFAEVGNGDFYFSNGRGDFIHYQNKKFRNIDLGGSDLRRIYLDKQNYLWLSTLNNGTLRLNGKQTEIIPVKNALIACQDFQQNYWAYTASGDLFKVSRHKTQVHPSFNALIADSRKAILKMFGTKLYLFTGGEFLIETNQKYPDDKKLISLPRGFQLVDFSIDKDSSIYISSRGEVFYTKGREKWKKVELNHPILSYHHRTRTSLQRLNKHKSDEIYGFHNRYLFRLKSGRVEQVYEPFSEYIKQVATYKDSLIVVTNSAIHFLDLVEEDSKKKRILIPGATSIQVKPLQQHLILIVNGKEFWVYKQGNLKKVKTEDFFSRSSFIQDITMQSGFILGEDWFHYSFVKNKPENLQIDYGFSVPHFNTQAFVSNREKAYWIYKDQLLSLSFNSFNGIDFKPRLKGLKTYLDGSEIDLKSPIPYDFQFLRLDIEAINFNQEDLLFRYKIIGYAEKWNYSRENQIQLTSLPSGNYKIVIQALSGKKDLSEPLEIDIKIEGPIWSKAWFWILTIIALLGLILLFVRYRLNKIRKENKIALEKIRMEQLILKNQMNPHFIFNIISSLNFLLIDKQLDKAFEFLSLFSKQLRSILNYSAEEYISIKDEIVFLQRYLSLENFRLENSIQWSIELENPALEEKRIPVFLIQPLIENAIQHGLKRTKSEKYLNVFIQTSKEGFVEVLVRNTGLGFSDIPNFKERKGEKHSDSYRSALMIIYERLEKHNQSKLSCIEIERDIEFNNVKYSSQISIQIKLV